MTNHTRLRWALLALLNLLLFTSSAYAGEVLEKTLPNGLRIVVQENPSSPTVSVNVFIAAGSLDETPETTGLAHFYEHMFFRGTPTLSGLDFKKSIESLGGITNASTAKDMTHYYIALPAEHASKGLSLLADALIRAELSQEGVDVERDVVLEEYRIGENSAGRIAAEKLYKMAYGDHPYGMSTIGTKERLKSYQRVDFLKWRNQQYGPNRCTVVVVGDIEPKTILRQAERHFASYQGQSDKRVLDAPPEPPAEPVYAEGYGPVGGAMVLLGFPAPEAKSEDVFAVDVLSFLLGQGKHSYLHQKLVEEKKLAEAVDATYLTPRIRGLLILSAQGEGKNAGEIRAEILKALEDVKAGRFDEKQLERAKIQLLQSYRQGNETNSGKASSIGFYATLGVPEFWKIYEDRVAAVGRKDVIEVASRYLGPGHWGYTMTRGSQRRSSR